MQRQYSTFRLGEGLFGIDVLLVREINRNLDISEVSPAPEYVRGLLNLRGQIVTIFDLGIQLGIGLRQAGEESCCVVLKTDQELERLAAEGLVTDATCRDPVGLFVDAIGDMVMADDAAIESSPANVGAVDARYIKGVVKLDQELLILLNVTSLLKFET